MVLNAGNILLVGAVLLFVSILAGKAGSKFGVPVLLLFLGVGMVFGSDGLGIQFNSPTIAQFIGMIALSVILFFGRHGHEVQGNPPRTGSRASYWPRWA